MRKYFLELFAIGLVDSEGRINTEHMTSDALMTSMKTMEELTKMKMDAAGWYLPGDKDLFLQDDSVL